MFTNYVSGQTESNAQYGELPSEPQSATPSISFLDTVTSWRFFPWASPLAWASESRDPHSWSAHSANRRGRGGASRDLVMRKSSFFTARVMLLALRNIMQSMWETRASAGTARAGRGESLDCRAVGPSGQADSDERVGFSRRLSRPAQTAIILCISTPTS